MKELVQEVKQWGSNKGLDKVGHLAQAEYTLKETAELLDAYADKDIEKINDAIGDILVTLIVGASNDESIYEAVCEELADDIYRETVISSLEDLRNSIPELVSSSFRLIRRKNNPSRFDYLDCIRDLNRIRTRMNEEFDFVCSINHCLELAYNEIKDRTGHTDENGHFIKDN